MRRVLIIVASILLLGGIAGYMVLGGFKKPEIKIITANNYILAGVPFKGAASDEELLNLFDQTRNYHQQGQLKGTLAALYYENPDTDKGKVDAFVGVLVKDSSAVLPQKYQYKFIAATKSVQATITAHYLVAPSPQKIRATMLGYAQEKNLSLQNFVIEQYLTDTNIILHIPVKGN